MEQLTNHDRLTDKASTEVSVKKQVQIEYLPDGKLRPYAGHTLFEIDTKTLEVLEAEYKMEAVIDWFQAVAEMANPVRSTKEVIKRKGCVYISALNAEKALERYLKGKGSAALPVEKIELV